MTSFWPKGLSLQDMRSPYEILVGAQQEWEQETEGAMTLVLRKTKSESGNAMIIVHSRYVPGNRTASLLSVVHRPDVPYPATIQPRNDDLPSVLRRSYYKPGMGDFGSGLAGIATGLQGRTVTNEWVSDTPSEFQEKLAAAFNLSAIKTAIVGLATEVTPATPEDTGNATQDESAAE